MQLQGTRYFCTVETYQTEQRYDEQEDFMGSNAVGTSPRRMGAEWNVFHVAEEKEHHDRDRSRERAGIVAR